MNLIFRLYVLSLIVCSFLSYETQSNQNFNIACNLNLPSEFEKFDFEQKDTHLTPFEVSESNEKYTIDLVEVNQKVNHFIFGSFHTLKDVITNTPKKLLTRIDFVRIKPPSVALYVLYHAWKMHI